jgi:serine/threonine protein kinase
MTSEQPPSFAEGMSVLAEEIRANASELTPSEIIPMLRLDQQERWSSGDRVPAEVYVQLLQQLSGSSSGFELIYAEFLTRERLGENPQIQEYAQRFPDHVHRLQGQIKVHAALKSIDISACPELQHTSALAGARGAADEELPSIPGYTIVSILGEGGMGVVYRAIQQSLNRQVAIKIIGNELLNNKTALARFRREAQMAARLGHPNIVSVFDAGEFQGLHFHVMEYVEGKDLDTLVSQFGPLPISLACDFVNQVAQGLQHAFERGIVHRDIKPSNLIVVCSQVPASVGDLAGRQVKVLDMGLVLCTGMEGVDDQGKLTVCGDMVGTPLFMAPEQIIDAHQVDIRADLYSLGCTFYFLLTGKVPFAGRHVLDTLDMHRWIVPRSMRFYRKQISEGLDALVQKLLAKRPEDRFQTPAELIQALGALAAPEASPAPPPGKPIPASAIATPAPTGKEKTAPTPLNLRIRKLKQDLADFVEKDDFVNAGKVAQKILLLKPNDSAALAANVFMQANPPRRNRAEIATRAFAGHIDAVLSIAFTRDGQRIISGGKDETVRIWSVRTGKELHCVTRLSGSVKSVALSADDRYLLAACDKIIHLFETDTAREIRRFVGWRGVVNSVAFSGDGRQAVSGSHGRMVHLWDLNTGQEIKRMKGHHSEVQTVAVNGVRALSGSHHGTLRLWDISTGRQIGKVSHSTSQVCSVAFSPIDSEIVLFASSDNCIYLWDFKKEQNIRRLAGHDKCVTSAVFSPDGRRVLSGSADRTVRVWDVDTGREVHRYADHADVVTSVVFSPDGTYAVSGSADRTIRLRKIPR